MVGREPAILFLAGAWCGIADRSGQDAKKEKKSGCGDGSAEASAENWIGAERDYGDSGQTEEAGKAQKGLEDRDRGVRGRGTRVFCMSIKAKEMLEKAFG